MYGNDNCYKASLENDLLQGVGRHAPHAVKQRQSGQVLQEPLIRREELGIPGVVLHHLVPLLSILNPSLRQHQGEALPAQRQYRRQKLPLVQYLSNISTLTAKLQPSSMLKYACFILIILFFFFLFFNFASTVGVQYSSAGSHSSNST